METDSLKRHIENKNFVAGIRQLDKLAAEGTVCHVYLAADADDAFKKKALKIAETAGAEVTVTGTRKELAAACGIRRIGCAVIGILSFQKPAATSLKKSKDNSK